MKNTMKILFLSTNDTRGGAARATHWLAKGLINCNQDVHMISQEKMNDDSWVTKIEKNNFQKFFDKARPHIDKLPLSFYQDRQKAQWSLNLIKNSKLLSAIDSYNPDIINLHWIGDGFVPINLIKNIKKPIIWSLYDMWPFTGGCHYASCENGYGYSNSCGTCPQLKSNRMDVSSHIHSRKMKQWNNLDMTIVAPSRWLANEAKKSSLFKDLDIKVIPHGTDLNIFKPLNKQMAREILGLDKNKRYLLFGSGSGLEDKRKGFQYLLPALKKLSLKKDYNDVNILIFGSSEPKNTFDFGFPSKYLGRLHDDVTLSIIYSAADLTVTPSTQEAFGMTASESMACGTPVLAFGVCGPLDVIDHKINGYLAKPFNIEDLVYGLEWLLNKENTNMINANSRKKCELEFDLKKISQKYVNLYDGILKTEFQK